MDAIFPLLILNARPAAGKSEIIDALHRIPVPARSARFHIGELVVFDDFPLLWAWFEEDQILEEVFDRRRLHTTPDGYFRYQELWHLLIRRLNLNYAKWLRDDPEPATAIVEFSRGSGHGGYRSAYQHLSEEILARACALYVNVSFEESLRKNRARFNPDRPDSILEHGLSDEKMRRLYRRDDWDVMTAGDPDALHVKGHRLPYAIFENHDDVTTAGGDRLLNRLEDVLGELWDRRQAAAGAG